MEVDRIQLQKINERQLEKLADNLFYVVKEHFHKRGRVPSAEILIRYGKKKEKLLEWDAGAVVHRMEQKYQNKLLEIGYKLQYALYEVRLNPYI
jgi:flagellar basal body rod protein FlgF